MTTHFLLPAVTVIILVLACTAANKAYGYSIFQQTAPGVSADTTSHCQSSIPGNISPSTVTLTQQLRPGYVKITSPAMGKQVFVGKEIVIVGSPGNSNSSSGACQVSLIVYGINPHSTAPNESDDSSMWSFTLAPKYSATKEGQNKLTAQYSCSDSPSSLSYNSVSLTAIPGANTSSTRANQQQHALAPREYEINLKLNYAHFISILTSTNNSVHQIKVVVNYTVARNASILNKPINAIMKVYATNGTLIKSSSFPNGFVAKGFGSVQLATALKRDSIEQLTAVVQFSTKDKMQALSNSIPVKLIFGQKISSTK
jgi:hypothetical protein